MSQTEVQLIKDAVIVNADVSNSAAIDVSKISGVMPLAGGTFTGDITIPESIIHAGDTDTKIRFNSTDQIKLETAGVERVHVDGVEVVFNEASSDTDFRIEGNGDANLFKVDAGNDQIGIGTATVPSGFKLAINGDLSLGETSGTDNTFIDQKQDGALEIINSGRADNDGQVRINRFNNVSGGTTHFRDTKIYNGKNSLILNIDGSADAVLPGSDSSIDLGSNSVRFQNGYFDTLYGDGSNLTGVSSTTINNNADNRVITGSGTANTLEAESAITINSNRLFIGNTNPAANANADDLCIGDNDGSAESGITLGSNTASGIRFADGGNNSAAVFQYTHGSTNSFQFSVEGTERLRINSSGHLDILDGDLLIGTAGHGISFAADGNESGATGELLDD